MKHPRAPTNWHATKTTCAALPFIMIALLLAWGHRVRAAGAPGDLDPAFGNGGKVITDFQWAGWASDLAVQPDGKIVVAGGGGDLAIARFNPDGTLDSLFGGGGIVTTNIGAYVLSSEVGILPDGRIVASAWGLPVRSSWSAALVCYRPDGLLDQSFGVIAMTDFFLGGMAIQTDGRIILASTSRSGFVLVRYNPDGSNDTSFGSGGKLLLGIPDFFPSPSAVTVQSDGRIVVAGSATGPGLAESRQFAVIRLNSDGSLDPTFGTAGIARTDFPGDREGASEILLAPDGRILIAGSSGNQTSDDLALVRYNSDGSLDTSFGDGGKVITDVDVKDYVRDIALQPDGRIVVAKSPPFELVRYNPDGRLDSTFGNGGVVSTVFSDAGVQLQSEVRGVAYVGHDRLVAVGGRIRPETNTMMSGFALACYVANSSGTATPTPTPIATPTPITTPSATPTPTPPASNSVLQFSASNFDITEDCATVTITVNRIGDTSTTASVDYSTANVSATDRGDYITTLGKLQFAAGETSKSFAVLINEDSYVEGNETFNVTLSNPIGASLGASLATVTIKDDPVEPASNAIDDPATFVCQHYHDFLNRQPDQGGWDFWTKEITSCGTDPACLEARRVNVSAAFFLSIEFQQTGYLVERMYKVAYGDGNSSSTLNGSHQLSIPLVRWNQFLLDTQKISRGVIVLQPGWETVLENNKQAFAREFVERPDFYWTFPTSMTPMQFVTKLSQNTGGHLEYGAFAIALSFFGNATDISDANACAQATRWVAEVYLGLNSQRAEFNRAFTLMQYFGYLRRNPNDSPDRDYTGYDFWLTKLNQFNGNYVEAEMVKAFITSAEYRQRFGSN